MASNIKFPESTARWFIEGDKLCLITKVDSSGNTRTSARKQWKAISEAVTNGILLSNKRSYAKDCSLLRGEIPHDKDFLSFIFNNGSL